MAIRGNTILSLQYGNTGQHLGQHRQLTQCSLAINMATRATQYSVYNMAIQGNTIATYLARETRATQYSLYGNTGSTILPWQHRATPYLARATQCSYMATRAA